MAYEPQPMPPEAYANPYAAGAVTMEMLGDAARGVRAILRRRREVRMLNRIPVLPTDWAAAGRHSTHH